MQFRARVLTVLRSVVGKLGAPKGIWAVFKSNCAIRSFFQVLRFVERGTEGKCVMLTQVNGLLGAGVVAWRARDVLGWVTCYVR